MANRFQHLLLGRSSICRQLNRVVYCLALLLPCYDLRAESSGSIKDVDTELFEFGLTVGVINKQDFGSEFVVGFNGTFKASEDFFLQLNYLQTDVGVSSYEKISSVGRLTGDRMFRHYDLVVGLNIFQGEVFGDGAGLSSLYLVGGVGDTSFLDKSGFTYTLGIGYQMALSRRSTLRFDYRDYLYNTKVLTGDSEELSIDVHMSAGWSWLF